MKHGWPKTYAKQPVISNDNHEHTWSLTVGGVSNSRSLPEPGCVHTATEIGGTAVYASVVGARSAPSIESIFSGEILKKYELYQ